ncbi:MAG TPA: hypothetical protein VK724_24110 [Bryobacteraceae bacterium]|nr:hypothetical protein [Bryobacteraceae bacterium]
MMQSQTALRFLLFGLLTAPLLAQTQIGGGTCNSASLSGAYAVSITGRQVSASGDFTGAFQATGTATFDGLSAVNIALTADTNQAVATQLQWSGTYSVQANCVAVVNITTGGSATLNVTLYNQGKNFLLSGSDATYTYSGSGNPQPQPVSCSAATLTGVFTFNATGFLLTSTSVSGAGDGAGLLQFDGISALTVNVTSVTAGAASSAVTLTGSYSISSNCTGSAMLTDSNSHPFVMSFSIYSVAAANTNFFASLARSGNFFMIGGGHTAYAQTVAPASQTISGGTCSTSNLSGVYALSLSGRGISSAGNFAGSFQGIGTATFDGQGNVTLAGTDNTNLAQGQSFSYTGTYSIPSNCSGTATINTTGGAAFTLVVWSSGATFAMVGSDATYVYSATGGLTRLPACATSTLSGEYSFTASGFTQSGTTQNGSEDEAGVLEFDGQGNVTAKYTDTQSGITPASLSATGNYAVTSACLASATLGDSNGKSNTLNFVISGTYGQNLDLLAANSQFVRTGSAHSSWDNPSQAIGNLASYVYSSTPPGSIFVLFGLNLATRDDVGVTVPLSHQLADTSVTVNGEPAPLFFVSAGQIDAQMPWDIPGNTVASVIVTNGSSVSGAAAVYVPASGTPGIVALANNRAAVVNGDGVLNSGSAPASVGDEVVVYFTGGGPVQASGTLTAGDPSPAGLSPVEGDHSITVGGASATVVYMGLTPGSVGLYQANFIVPQVAKGTYPVVITIAGQASNNPVMTVSN